ncbi:MAG: hypothetical protein KTR31_31670 [Myxococcales bacterium]|nr:hypothetical protein [Myxococcales bacterium]
MTATLLASLWACAPSPAPRWAVREALDVPPPPGAVSLDLGPTRTDTVFSLGTVVQLREGSRTVRAEVLDVRQDTAGTLLTVYADAEGAQPWLEAAKPVDVEITR